MSAEPPATTAPGGDRAAERTLLAGLPQGLCIGGAWRPSAAAATFAVDDPSTGESLGVEVADGDREDALAALDAAAAAQGEWARTAPRERSEVLRRAYERILERAEDLALLMTLEMGKPLADSRSEVRYGAEFFRWFSEEAVRLDGRYTVAPGGDGRIVVSSRPVGPALLITPWNFPLAMLTRKIGAAVAAGCTMVLKPSELTPLTALVLTEELLGAGLPPGVCNLVTTTRAAEVAGALLDDPRLRKVSFTGSTAVGKRLHAQASERLQRLSLELGGNAPFVVFDDADLDAALDGAVVAKMRNMGEACTAANRFLVHESVAERFTEGLVARLSGLRSGRGTQDGVTVGPLIGAAARAKVAGLVDDAVSQGAELLVGGVVPDGSGWFYPPTVLGSVPAGARILHEEIFGPVAPITTFADEDEAIALANETDAGLVAYLYTAGLDRALRVAESIEAGMVGVNRGVVSNPAAPFGGIKQSGLGREGGAEGVDAYRETTYIGIALDD